MLSLEQKKVVEQSGRFIVQACPGSGKTFTVAHRLAKRLKEWKHHHAGIATLSFTNVAHEEISKYLQELGLSAPSHPHFLGTIDSFINTWIFLPFGHLVMECQMRPSIVGIAYTPWLSSGYAWAWRKPECNRNRCRLTDFTFDIAGNLINLDGERSKCPQGSRPCQRLKKQFISQGYATQTDANYWAMKILETYPQVAQALSRRFPQMIIDEAQDTSDVQMRIVDMLTENGLAETMLVGDPDQAIYEWRDAKPEIFVSKTDAEGWAKPLDLLENRRSSKHICEATIGFAKYLSEPSNAVGKDANYEVRPTIIEYTFEDIYSLQDEFIARCQRCGIQPRPDKVAILVRTRRILRHLLGIPKEVNPWNHEITHLLAEAAYLYGKKDPRQALHYVRTAMVRLCFSDRNHTKLEIEQRVISAMGAREWKVGLWQFLKQLPPADLKLTDWIVQTNENLEQWFTKTKWPVADTDNLILKVKRRAGKDRTKAFLDWAIADLFAEPSHSQGNVTIETVHAAKGKTYDAVLFVVSDKISKTGTAKQLGERPDGDEEIRIAYVAMTRPRKLLVVAVPNGTDAQHLRRFPDWMKTELSGAVQLSLF